MTYELAKQLKDAGFPQPQPIIGKFEIHNGERIYLPTLSELIAMSVIGGRAIMLRNDTYTEAWHVSSGLFAGNGETPEEAVAMLWLALNKNVRI